LIKRTRQELAKKVASSIVFLVVFPNPSYAIEHEIVPRDTLWDLATEHLRSPWDWPYITNLDGSQVEDVYSIPDGHKVWIPSIEDIAHLPIPFEEAGAPEVVILAAKRNKATAKQFEQESPVKALEEPAAIKQMNLAAPAKQADNAKSVFVSKPASASPKQSLATPSNITATSKTTVTNPYHYLLVNKKEGLVRAFIDGQHVTIPVSKLVELYADANPGLDVKKIGDGIAISKTLIKEMLGLNKKD